MALIEELERQGNFLFRWRSYVPSVIILFSFFFVPTHTYPGDKYETHLWYGGLCFLVSLFGLFIRCITIGYVPQMTSGRNTKKQVADTVNQTGIYSLVRHPLYIGNFFMFFGIVLFVYSISLTVLFVLFYWFYYERIMFTEEQFLRQKFGQKYLTWANKTPAVIPNFENYRTPELTFSFRNIIKREYPSLFGILIMFGFYDLILIYFKNKEAISSGQMSLLQPHHIYLFAGSFAFYLIVRIIVKTTKWLVVEGR